LLASCLVSSWVYMCPSTSNLPVFILTVPKSPGCVVREEVRHKRNKGPRREGVANVDVYGRVPVWPLCGRLLNQIDVLALSILLCAEEKHDEGAGATRGTEP
jgi:hypothetical protein